MRTMRLRGRGLLSWNSRYGTTISQKWLPSRAVKLNPNLARTQSILGFANLTRIDIKAAKENFNKAIELDQADPLPRLGIGLAKIREGNLTEGREAMEIATALEPENSLIRSYLGKEYYEETRDDRAGTQFALAKERDSNDPTPHFYNAIREQARNRPGQALQDLNKSIQLNENRAVYRSQLLIDDDQAARTTSRANIYGELGFERLAIYESAKALAENAANDSANRELAIAYANIPRHDIARLSEALQAQLRQPLSISPINPQISSDNLVILRDAGPSGLGVYEFNQLFSRDQVRVQFDGVVGSLGTRGDQFIVSGLTNRVAYAVSQLHYETDGFGENNDTKKNAYDIFVQGDISPSVSVQANIRKTDFSLGQTFFQFDPSLIFPAKIREKSESLRIGGRFVVDTGNDWIWSMIYEDRFRVGETFPDGFIVTTTDFTTYTAELQHIRKLGESQIIGGLGHIKEKDVFALEGGDSRITSTNAYLYSIWSPRSTPLKVQLGFSLEWFRLKNSFFDDPIVRRRFNPKLGLVWNPMIDTTIRASITSSVKRPFIGGQTLEPTQVVGFNQFFTGFDTLFGDRDGTISRRIGIALDQRFSGNIFAGLELSARKLQVRSLNVGEVDWQEKTAHAYLHKAFPRPIFHGWQFAASAEYEYEQIVRPQLLPEPEGIVDVETHRIPLGFRLYRDSG